MGEDIAGPDVFMTFIRLAPLGPAESFEANPAAYCAIIYIIIC